jgi:hypothetical protein
LVQTETWKVFFHDDFDPEFDAFSKDVQDELLAAAVAIKKLGPAADRPHVGTLSNPKHANMKELRFKANNGAEIWRAAFAFDPAREAVILVAAAKQGLDEDKFYKDLLKKANDRFDKHLKCMNALKATKLAKTRAKSIKRKQ